MFLYFVVMLCFCGMFYIVIVVVRWEIGLWVVIFLDYYISIKVFVFEVVF